MINSLLDFFIESAHAAAPAGAPPAQGGFSMLIIMLVFVGFMYLTVWRPQAKRNKEHKELLSALVVGDEVVTLGGVLGKVSKLADNFIVISVADKVDITVQRSAISNVLPKGTFKSV
ncbi:MAG: preprotein translocase subunit YajC [Pseudomonadota bacterium]